MQIVTDSGADLTSEQLEGLKYTMMPLTITLDGISYRSGIDVTHEEFYDILDNAEGMPVTSLPSPGEFAENFRKLAETDPDILSVNISSGLSGTYNAALEGAKMASENNSDARIEVFDTMTLSGEEGWFVEAACRAANAGWGIDQTVELLTKMRSMTHTVYTLPTLKYLINGGRISHITGLIASALRIMPIIGVGKEDGKYFQRSRQRTFKRAMSKIPDMIAEHVPFGSRLRVQVMHAHNPEGAVKLRDYIDKAYDCEWLPIGPIAPVLGAHTGIGLVGCAYALADEFPELP